jgi:hypothetical protein
MLRIPVGDDELIENDKKIELPANIMLVAP